MTLALCRNGHSTARNKHGQCLECARENSRKWKAKNRDHAKNYSDNWRKTNPEKYSSLKKRTNEKRKNASEEEKEIVRLRNKIWQKNNPEKAREINRIRAAFRRNSTPKWANKNLIRLIYEKCPKGMHVDHIIPTKGKNVCGLHIETNLQYLTPKENMKKLNSFDEEEFNNGSPVFSAPLWINTANLKPYRIIYDPRNGLLIKDSIAHRQIGETLMSIKSGDLS